MNYEIDSFFTKFKHLLHAGYHAILTQANVKKIFSEIEASNVSESLILSTSGKRRKSFYDCRRNTANVVPTYSDVSNITEAINGMEAIEETGDEVSVINENQIDDACRKVCM